MSPDATRRALLGTVAAGATVGIAGCTTRRDTPAGTLGFVNGTDLPHSVTVGVEAVGSRLGSEPGTVAGDPEVPASQRRLRTTVGLEPGERRRYERAFTAPSWYLVGFAVDGRVPRDDRRLVRFSPAPDDGPPGRWLRLVAADRGFDWRVVATDNARGLSD